MLAKTKGEERKLCEMRIFTFIMNGRAANAMRSEKAMAMATATAMANAANLLAN